MLIQIISRTPSWVWALFLALLVLGALQMRQRSTSLLRQIVLPMVLVGLSLLGVLSAFHRSPVAALIWACAAAAVAAWVLQLPMAQGTRYDRATGLFTVPGSWVPLALIMGIFVTKYAVGVSLGMQPQLADNASVAYTVSALYGVMSGAFAGRALRLLGLARPVQGPAHVTG